MSPPSLSSFAISPRWGAREFGISRNHRTKPGLSTRSSFLYRLYSSANSQQRPNNLSERDLAKPSAIRRHKLRIMLEWKVDFPRDMFPMLSVRLGSRPRGGHLF